MRHVYIVMTSGPLPDFRHYVTLPSKPALRLKWQPPSSSRGVPVREAGLRLQTHVGNDQDRTAVRVGIQQIWPIGCELPVVQISAGETHNVAVTASGDVYTC